MQTLGQLSNKVPLQRWGEWLERIGFRIQNWGLIGQQSQKQKQQIRILNTANIGAMLPVKLVLACSYGWIQQWPAAIFLALCSALVIAYANMHRCHRINPKIYLQATLIASFTCPFILTFLLGGYHNSSLAMLWSFLTPMLAILLGRPKTALRWLFLFFAGCQG